MVKKYYNDRGKLLSYSFHGFLAMEMIRNIFMQTMRDLMRLELFFEAIYGYFICCFIWGAKI